MTPRIGSLAIVTCGLGGFQGVVELGLIMGNYSLLALLINSFGTDLPPERSEPLLPV